MRATTAREIGARLIRQSSMPS
jgi:hypothetical protein